MDSGGHSLTLTRVLPASREAVFAAWTTEEGVRRWMCPEGGSNPVVELDVRVGGAFRIDMLHGGDHTVHTGEYLEVTPPERLVFTWTSKYTHHLPTLVTLELRARGEETELTLTHARLPDAEAVERHSGGWARFVARLASAVHSDPDRTHA
jgi:uncharacterized protein YndB with AHSA1/START domain